MCVGSFAANDPSTPLICNYTLLDIATVCTVDGCNNVVSFTVKLVATEWVDLRCSIRNNIRWPMVQ